MVVDGTGTVRQPWIDTAGATAEAADRSGRPERTTDPAPAGICILDLDGHETWSNEVLRYSLGYSAEEFAAMPCAPSATFAHRDDRGADPDRFARMVAGEVNGFATERRFTCKDGSTLWVAETVSLVRDPGGNPVQAICVTQDITESKRPDFDPGAVPDFDPRAVEERSHLQVEQVPAVVYVAEPGPNGTWFYVSPQIEAMLGFSAPDWMADPSLWLQQLQPQDRESVLAEERRLLVADDAEDPTSSQTYRLRHRNGSTVWVRDDAMMLWDKEGRATWHGVLVDVTREKLLEERLEHQAFHDPLTGLPNRKLFHDRVGHALSRRQSGQVAVLFIDLDNFKTVNDSFGHAGGDEVIIAAARRLQACARAGDTAARLGGDEFALLLEDVTTEQVSEFADRVLAALSEAPVEFSGRPMPMAASIGIAIAGPGENTATLLRNADLAMYEAKLQGRCRHVLYEPSMHATVGSRSRLGASLQTALSDDAVSVAYQPLVDLRNGAVVGIEALARWTDQEIGEVPPNRFIPIAEESGLIHKLGFWAIERACRDLRKWRSAQGVDAYVSINVSPIQFDNDQFANSVVRVLLDQGLKPSDLMIEVAEGALLVERSRQSLRELRSHGVRVAVDDFGTGYTSLSYLSRLPADLVKIDQSFLRPLGDTSADPALLRAIIRLAETLHLATICKGIETLGQLSDLQEAGCFFGQGTLLARPGPLDEIPATVDLVSRTPARPRFVTGERIAAPASG